MLRFGAARGRGGTNTNTNNHQYCTAAAQAPLEHNKTQHARRPWALGKLSIARRASGGPDDN